MGLGHNHECFGLSIDFRAIRVKRIPQHLSQAHQFARIKRATLVGVVVVERLLADVDIELEAVRSRKSAPLAILHKRRSHILKIANVPFH